jgi:hypothetical protein
VKTKRDARCKMVRSDWPRRWYQGGRPGLHRKGSEWGLPGLPRTAPKIRRPIRSHHLAPRIPFRFHAQGSPFMQLCTPATVDGQIYYSNILQAILCTSPAQSARAPPPLQCCSSPRPSPGSFFLRCQRLCYLTRVLSLLTKDNADGKTRGQQPRSKGLGQGGTMGTPWFEKVVEEACDLLTQATWD